MTTNDRGFSASDFMKALGLSYIVNSWRLPGLIVPITGGSAPGANSIRLFPALILDTVTISAVSLKIGTAAAGGNIQAAIYASDPVTKKPTGTALVSTASMATDAASSMSSNVSVQLTPGLYWFATNADNATVVCTSINGSSAIFASVIGSTAAGNNLGSTSACGYSVAQTFGTWPDLTSASFSDVVSSSIPAVEFKVASVP